MERDFDAVITSLNFDVNNRSKNYYGMEISKYSKLIKDELENSSPDYKKLEGWRRKLFLYEFDSDLATREYKNFMNSYSSFKDLYEMLCYLRLYVNNIILSLKSSPESIHHKIFEMLKGGNNDESLNKLITNEVERLYSKKTGKKQSINKLEKKFVSDLKSLGKFKVINRMVDLGDKYPYNYISVKDALLFRYFNYNDLLSEVKSEINERFLNDDDNAVIKGLDKLQESNSDSEKTILLHKLRDIVFTDNVDYDGAKLGEYYEKLFFVSKSENIVNYLNNINEIFSKVDGIKGNNLFVKVEEIIKYLDEYKDSILSSFNYNYLKQFINYYTKISNLSNPSSSPKSDAELAIRKKKINDLVLEVSVLANKLGIVKGQDELRRSR